MAKNISTIEPTYVHQPDNYGRLPLVVAVVPEACQAGLELTADSADKQQVKRLQRRTELFSHNLSRDEVDEGAEILDITMPAEKALLTGRGGHVGRLVVVVNEQVESARQCVTLSAQEGAYGVIEVPTGTTELGLLTFGHVEVDAPDDMEVTHLINIADSMTTEQIFRLGSRVSAKTMSAASIVMNDEEVRRFQAESLAMIYEGAKFKLEEAGDSEFLDEFAAFARTTFRGPAREPRMQGRSVQRGPFSRSHSGGGTRSESISGESGHHRLPVAARSQRPSPRDVVLPRDGSEG